MCLIGLYQKFVEGDKSMDFIEDTFYCILLESYVNGLSVELTVDLSKDIFLTT